nr:prolyl oligopeptidase family serine peptidase [uncultured Holophaga sp.]
MKSLPAALTLLTTTALAAQSSLPVPVTRKGDVVDDYFGTKVADPYRWLEDDNSAETRAWVKAQNKVTDAYLAGIPERKAIQARMTALWNYEKFSAPSKKGNRYFYSHNTGLQSQNVIFVTEDPKAPGRVLLDPNTLSKEGTVALSGLSLTEDGRLLAYAISVAGSDWQTWKVRDVATGQDLPDEVNWAKSSGAAWLKNGSGFFYSRYDAPKEGDALKGINQNHQVFFHRLGTPQAQDRLVYARPDQPEWYLHAGVTDDGRWLVITAAKGTDPRTSVFLQDLDQPGAGVEPFLTTMDASYEVEDNEGDTFFVRTDKDAPRYRLLAIPREHPEPAAWREILPQGRNRDVLQGVSFTGGRLVATWMRDAHSAIEFYDRAGHFQSELKLPTLGSAGGFGGKRDEMEAFYTFTSFAQPPTIYRYDFRTGKSEVFRESRVAFDPGAYETEQVFYPSKDGTKIPLFLVHRKGLKLDGQNPTLLYGYGGFNISLTPSFSVPTLVWLEMGGVYAMANLRGGGEYGMDWYNAGRLDKKQNVFDDFIAAGEWLVAKGYTSTPRLAIQGGSNGGLLVGACLTQRPELWGAALPAVGVMDMLRFHKFTLGWGWKSDYGSSETQAGFNTLIKYSPLQNIHPGTKYPPTLVSTSDHDDRVVPAHSHKFTATLQAAQGGSAPILTRIETNAGHGAGKPTAMLIAERADLWTFLLKNLGFSLPMGFGSQTHLSPR